MIKKITLMRLALMFLLLAVHSLADPEKALAQQLKNITGIVRDGETNEPIPGVSIKLQRTNAVVTTDVNGKYGLRAAATDRLIFSYVGYESKNLLVAEKTTMNVALRPMENALNEVVVIGYGTTTRADLTGSVGQVKMADVEKAPVGSFEESLAGRVAGVNVSAADGQPGKSMNIIIRGGNSLTQSNAPLYVIDGFPVEDPDNAALNPDDIESMNILKDASATAIYGSRGANGVVIIETKKGKIGAPVITINNSIGFQQVQKTIPLMSPYEFIKYQSEFNPSVTNSLYFKDGRTLESYRDAQGIEWQDEVFRMGLNRIHNIAIRGGTAQTKYSISGSGYGQKGILLNSGYDRYQGRANVDQTISKTLKAGINMNYSKRITNGTAVAEGEGSSFTTYLLSRVWGYRPVNGGDASSLLEEDIDEDALTQFDARFNPVVTSTNAYQKGFITDFLANAYITYDISKSLQLKMTGTVSTRNSRSERFFNSKTPQGSLVSAFNNRGINAGISFSERTILSNENTLTYNKVFNKAHKLTLLAGASIQGSNANSYGFSNQQIPNEGLGMSGLDQGMPYSSSAILSEYSLLSGFSRLNYSFKSKYLLTATMRADGSSKFQNPWGYFPSVALAWNMQEESWLKNVKVVSESKIRMSYGLTGNNRLGEYDRFPGLIISFPASYSWNNSSPQQGAIMNSLGNIDLKWETTEQIDFGWDIGFFKNRIALTVDLYRKNTRDLLLDALLPTSTGFTSATKNIGSVRNEGVELTLNTVNVKNKSFTWSSNFNISFNSNKILSLTEGQDKLFRTPSFESQYNANPLYLSEIGRPAGMFYGYIWDGVYNYEDFDNPGPDTYVLKNSVPTNGNARSTIRPGDIKYRDLNGDGVVDNNDLTTIGRGLPVHSGGFNNTFDYKGFSLNVFLQWSYGNKIYNANRLMFDGNGNGRTNLNQYASYADRWSPENTGSTTFRTGGQGIVGYHSSRVLEDGSYLRLKTLSLGYDLPKQLIKGLALNRLNLSVAAQNLLTFTNYTGMDPEVSVRNSILTPGFDFSAYPIPRTMVVAIKATF
jgi:TonB-linked SusC/RagA family outer membrane protein